LNVDPEQEAAMIRIQLLLGKKLRRRATHKRLFDPIADGQESVRNSLRYFQTVPGKLLTLINGRSKKAPK
jgi:hypothetical protein